MQKQKVLIFIIAYVFIVVCDLICSSNEPYSDLRYYTKPSILGALITFLCAHKNAMSRSVFRLMIFALIFSLLGDVLLLFSNTSQYYFITGLVSFLSAHIVYIIVFNTVRAKKIRNWIFPILVGIYGIVLFCILYDGLGGMLIPVAIYMIVILLMSNIAFLRSRHVPQLSYILVFMGSLFFMLSDSLLAIDMFYKSLPLSNLWIMITYATAQLMIVYGIIRQKTDPRFT